MALLSFPDARSLLVDGAPRQKVMSAAAAECERPVPMESTGAAQAGDESRWQLKAAITEIDAASTR